MIVLMLIVLANRPPYLRAISSRCINAQQAAKLVLDLETKTVIHASHILGHVIKREDGVDSDCLMVIVIYSGQ